MVRTKYLKSNSFGDNVCDVQEPACNLCAKIAKAFSVQRDLGLVEIYSDVDEKVQINLCHVFHQVPVGGVNERH